MKKITEYQKAVASHMECAPEELAEYVRGRLLNGNKNWEECQNPIATCGFRWYKSQEGVEFWEAIYIKLWKEAMNTNFWKEHTAQVTAQVERPKGVVGEWYTLTNDFYGCNETEDRKAGYTWECEEVDVVKEPMIDGVVIGMCESYRKATPKDIRRAMAERIKTYRQTKRRPSEGLTEGGYAEAIKAEYERLATKQVAKNSDYGDSAFEDIYLMGNTITAKQACIARMSDKIKRLQSTNLKVDESFFDTLDDLIGYIVVYNILNKR